MNYIDITTLTRRNPSNNCSQLIVESLLIYFETLPVWSKALWLVACFSLGGVLEVLIPFKSFHYQKRRHILFNLSFLLFIIPINLCFGLILVSTSAWIEHYHLGLFNQFSISLVTQLIVAVLAFDFFSQYCTHVLLHKVNWLWRLHMIHHSDTAMDTSTGTRHHPLDYICREISALLAIILLGSPVAFYAMYRLTTIFFTYFTHANISLPNQLDRGLSWVFITPNIHKFHHHYQQPWTDSNYGNIFSFWDRLFNTLVYDDIQKVEFGLDQLKGIKPQKPANQFWYLLRLPFANKW